MNFLTDIEMGYSEPVKRILIVDDDAPVADLIHAFLSDRGFDCEVFPDGRDLIPCISETRADLVISDILMPGLTGINLLNMLKRLAPEIPVILISAFPRIEFIRQAVQKGAADFLPKPIDLRALEHAVERVLNRMVVPSPPLSWKERRLSRRILNRIRNGR